MQTVLAVLELKKYVLSIDSCATEGQRFGEFADLSPSRPTLGIRDDPDVLRPRLKVEDVLRDGGKLRGHSDATRHGLDHLDLYRVLLLEEPHLLLFIGLWDGSPFERISRPSGCHLEGVPSCMMFDPFEVDSTYTVRVQNTM